MAVTESNKLGKDGMRQYDKGERRFKHVGKGPDPSFEIDDSEPKKWVGKCPNNISDEDKSTLLNQAIAVPNGDRELRAPKKLYAVHKGAIYEAQTSDHGRTYHGYPYRGKLSASVLRKLDKMARCKGCVDQFDRWVSEHIERHGA